MKIDFLVNHYLLIWNLLYGPSISMKALAFKQKLWLTYKKEYKLIENDKDKILKDTKNFIPDDNTLYEKLEGTLLYERLMRDTEKHRLLLLKTWDTSKRKVNAFTKEILRIDPAYYQVAVLPPYMNTCLHGEDTSNIGWGKKQDLNDSCDTLCQMIYDLLLPNVSIYSDELDQKIALATLELMIENELYTRISGRSNLLEGKKELQDIKHEIYPYFLMYMGVNLEDTTEYMIRDNFAFEIDKYTNEVQLKKLNYLEFIDFIVRNKKLILKLKKIGLEII